MPANTNALHNSIAEVTDSEGPEEELKAKGSTVKRFFPSLILKLTMAALCLLALSVV
jgi:hypothetical protein